MGLIGLFDIGKSALFASQTALSVTSNNIANANTPGYTRQEVILEIATPQTIRNGTLGRGVIVAGIKRHYDSFLSSQILGQSQSKGRSAALDQTWSQIEQIFNEMRGFGLSGPLNDYFNAWSEVANMPEAVTPRVSLMQKANAFITAAQRMERSLADTITNVNDGIEDEARQVNAIAADIAVLNGRIMQIEAGGADSANDLRDQRDRLMNELADKIEFTSYEDQNGSVTITVGMRSLVDREQTNELSTILNADGNRELVLDGVNITNNIRQGKIGGLLAARSDIEANAITGLRKLAAAVVQQVNSLHRQGFGLDGATGRNFFAPLKLAVADNASSANITSAVITNQDMLTLDEYRISFDAIGNYQVFNKQSESIVTSGAYNPAGTVITLPGISITISGAATPADNFTVSPLASAISSMSLSVSDPQEIAASSTSAGLPGDNTNALLLSALPDATVAGLGGSDFSSWYHNIVSTVGALSRAASDSLSFDENLLAELTGRRESVSGVSLDEEAVNLIRYQRSFEAGARMIKVADELLQTVLDL